MVCPCHAAQETHDTALANELLEDFADVVGDLGARFLLLHASKCAVQVRGLTIIKEVVRGVSDLRCNFRLVQQVDRVEEVEQL